MSTTPTIRDLAARLGLSRTTVSLALRNDPRIKPATRLKAQKMADSLGYRRSAMLTTLMTQVRARQIKFRGEVLAFITALTDEFYWKKQSEGEVFLGAQEMSDRLGFRLEPFWTGPRGVHSKQTARILRSRGVRGIIIPYSPLTLLPLELDWEHMPIVATGYSFRQKNPHRVAANQFDTAKICYQKLHEMGHRRIGLALEESSDSRVDNYWVSAYLGSQWRLGGTRLAPLDMKGVANENVFMHWFERARPDAIIGALGAPHPLDWLKNRGVRVPQDVSYATLDVQAGDKGRFAGVSQNHRLVGAGAINLLSSLIFRNESGLPEHPTVTMIDVSWMDGMSAIRRKPLRSASI